MGIEFHLIDILVDSVDFENMQHRAGHVHSLPVKVKALELHIEDRRELHKPDALNRINGQDGSICSEGCVIRSDTVS